MITNSGFWTGKQFDTAGKVLDGAVYFLEGARPEAAICDRKSYQFIGRRSLEYDKIGELCSRIMKYEEELEHKYVPRN